MHPGKGGHRDELWFSSYHTGVCWVVRVLNMTYTGVRFSFTSWLRRCLPGFSTAKLKHLFFFFFCIKSMYVLGSRYLTLFLVVPFFELLSYNKKFLTLGVLAWPGFKTEMCFDPS